MTCAACGAWAPAERETGYDGDQICATCAEKGWIYKRSQRSGKWHVVIEEDLCEFCGDPECEDSWEYGCAGRRRALEDAAILEGS
jgi:hypothetical protein